LTAQAEPPATKATTTSNLEDNYLANFTDAQLEERATEERSLSSPAFPGRQQWETVDVPVRRSFD
jgi:hypothetical protein